MASGSERTVAREREFDRFVTFLDAVAAIAITLLVLPLVDLVPEVSNGASVAHVLRGHLGQLLAFLLSFVLIARSWTAQHQALRNVVSYDRVVAWWLIFWTLTIVVLPFPTALLAVAGSQVATKLLYLGTLATNWLLLGATVTAVRARPRLTAGAPPPQALQMIATGATTLLALALSLAVPVLSYYPLLLLLVDVRVTRWVVAHRAGDRRGNPG